MKLWECRYTLDCPLWTDQHIDYWWSVSGPTQAKMQNYWEKVHPGYFTVTKFETSEVKVAKEGMVSLDFKENGCQFRSRLLDRVYKDRSEEQYDG